MSFLLSLCFPGKFYCKLHFAQCKTNNKHRKRRVMVKNHEKVCVVVQSLCSSADLPKPGSEWARHAKNYKFHLNESDKHKSCSSSVLWNPSDLILLCTRQSLCRGHCPGGVGI